MAALPAQPDCYEPVSQQERKFIARRDRPSAPAQPTVAAGFSDTISLPRQLELLFYADFPGMLPVVACLPATPRILRCVVDIIPALSQFDCMPWDDPQLNETAGRFFRTFARMEYALKQVTRFLKRQRDAEPDWTSFANEINVELAAANKKVRDAVRFLNDAPPKKQVVNDLGKIAWDDALPNAANEADLILLFVRRVRNNLFHGGKFNGHWFAPERSGELMTASLIILDFCREACADVAKAYHGDH